MNNNFSDTTLFTYDRLNNFVKNYKDYTTKLINSNTGPDGDRYKYYHFEYSPNGIIMTDIGRIPAEWLIPYNNWSSPPSFNTPDAWKMNISQTYNALKLQQTSNIASLSKTPGLQFKVITLPNTAYSLNPGAFQVNSIGFINAFQEPSANIISGPSIASSLDNYSNALLDPSGQIPIKSIEQQATIIGCEWYGYFNPSILGNYIFTITVGSGCYFYAWIGDKAVCEYTPTNSDINSGSSTATINITQNKYYPIRIQYYAPISKDTVANSSTLKFSLTIKQFNVNGTQTVLPTNQCLSYIQNNDTTTYYPPLQYLAFVSPSATDYHLGQFKCYQLDLTQSYSNMLSFYQFLNTYKFNMQAQKYNIAEDVIAFGQLPDNTNYSPVKDDPISLPDVYSIYRLDTDLRMGNTVQIDSQIAANGLYPMQTIEASSNIVQYSNTYNTFTQYYPNQTDITNKLFTNSLPDACKTSCDNSLLCKHYYTYTSNGNPQCIIDTANSIPTFNQIQPTDAINPVDAGSSSLFMRNYQFTQSSCGVLSNGQSDLVANIVSINNTDDYNSSFPYSNYDWSATPLTAINKIGICGDPSFNKLTNDAAQILFQDAEYYRNGTWTANTPGPATTAKESFQTAPQQTRYTNVIGDTNDSINASLQNEKQYAQMMQQVNQNYLNLSQKDIPEYLAMRKIMSDNPNYDFNGNELLYYRTKPIPTTLQKNILDSKEEGYAQNQIYILGTLTAATLLVLAIIIGRE